MSRHRPVLVVGAGFAGAVYARTLAEAGLRVMVIDKRPHIGGNCYDEVHATGVRFHVYGPHLFHTSNAHVVAWVTRFGAFTPYRHTVTARLAHRRYVPLPINRATLNGVFGTALSCDAQAAEFLRRLSTGTTQSGSAADYLNARIGRVLTDTFFRPYTRKMWARELEEMDAAVVQRIPIRFDADPHYFPNDTFQGLPRDGYTALFERIFDHPLVTLACDTPFRHAMLADYAFCFNSMPIDEFYGFRHGALPYRSIRFHHRIVRRTTRTGPSSVVNYTGAGRLTRRTDWSMLPAHRVFETDRKVITFEEPCCYTRNGLERYYPVRTAEADVASRLAAYRDLAAREEALQFIGRCGTYRYLDMHQVINQSLLGARRWLARHDLAARPADARVSVLV